MSGTNLLDPGNQNVDTSQPDYSDVVIDTGNSVADAIFNSNLDRTQGTDRSSANVPSENPGEPDRPFNPLSDSSTEAFFAGDETGGVVGTTFPDNPDWASDVIRDPRDIWAPTPSTDDIMDSQDGFGYDHSEIWTPTPSTDDIMDSQDGFGYDHSEIWQTGFTNFEGLSPSQNQDRRQAQSERNESLNDFVSETSDGITTVIMTPVEAVTGEATDRVQGAIARIVLFVLMLFVGASVLGGDL